MNPEVYQGQRIPTEQGVKNLVIEMLQELSKLYRQTLIGIQIAKLENKKDSELILNFHSYTSTIVTLYRIMKPKISLIDPKGLRFSELEILDSYTQILMEIDTVVDMEKTVALFQIFNIAEDQLRQLADELGYTSDKPKEDRY